VTLRHRLAAASGWVWEAPPFYFTPPSDTMKPREYCCCAIPVVNVGIYSTLTEQFVLGILAGTLSVATPDSKLHPPVLPRSRLRHCCIVVGAATPSFARWIFAAICYVGAFIQVLGFIGVARVCILFSHVHVHKSPVTHTTYGFRKNL
jgi:hypothetical protein